MKRKLSKGLVNGAAYLFSVVLLISMLAAPVIASVTANSVTSTHIKDNTILNRDIAPNKISSSRIKNYTILREDIHSASITKWKLVTGAVTSAKIEDGTIRDTDLSTKKGYVSLSVSAFNEGENGYNFTRSSVLSFTSGGGWFYANVQLPQGAVITKLRYTAWDNNAAGGQYTNALLRRIPHSDPASYYAMAEATTDGAPSSSSYRIFTDTSITNPAVDNNANSYQVRVYLAGPTNLEAGNVVIEYTYKR